MKKIIALVVVLAVVISVTIGVVAALSGPIGIVDPSDLASPNDNALQAELQEIATEYSYMLVSNMQDMLREEKNKLSIQDDFCNDLYFSEPKWDKVNKGYYITLYSRSGYYCGPIFFFDENGVRIKTAEEVFTLSPTYGLTFNPIWANYTIVTLDKVNPKFASEVTSYWLK
ncbi:MAG: hypothetical protein PHX52_02265 [Candidatus Pacebacteria bacterium]|nr:hypothetical protein [Candidatus Paceibacterota bacterium]